MENKVKSVSIVYRGKERVIRFEPVKYLEKSKYTYVYDKNGKSFAFWTNIEGKYIPTPKASLWPQDLLDMIDEILQNEVAIRDPGRPKLPRY